MTRRTVAVSIDLDAVACYYRIYGLGPAPRELDHSILERALPRAAKLFASRNIHVTWFVVGRDADAELGLDQKENAQRLGELAKAGDELGNHSYSHHYEMARLDAKTIDDEVGNCDRVLRAITGKPTRGFRAPGYDVSGAMLDALARRGYHYDSSIFPAPGYYAAKAAVMAALAIVRRPSGAVLANPRQLIAPTEPYRPSMKAPWRKGQAPLVELPIAVTPWTRIPAIGTSLIVAPDAIRSRVLSAMAARPLFNFELHGIDFADADKDGIPGELVARAPELRLPIADKLERLGAILDELARTREFVTLADAAADIQRER